MRLGGPVYGDCSTPEKWIAGLRKHGYTAAYCPVGRDASDDAIAAYAKAAKEANIVVAEAGAWSNPMSPNPDEREKALANCKGQLALAEKIGARCCVNIAGSRGADNWAGHNPLNLTEETFDLIVKTTREIIDSAKPTRTFYTLECMQWMYPDSVESYERLIKAIDRKAFAVHFDPTNLINSPWRFYHTGDIIREGCTKLGAQFRSCHAKDIAMSQESTVHLSEVRPGLGGLDYRAYLKELDKLDPDVPLMIEHLATEEEYALAAEHIRTVAAEVGVIIR
jgi:sugar phosphate isomerase/epimerase